ncbi:glutathione S-transferase family protein [Methylobacterium trifolii]
MALTLYTFGPHFGLPDPSPFVMKADLLLKMSGLPYATDTRGLRKAPKGKLPYLRDGDGLVADSTFIRWHLETRHGIDFDAGYAPRERATGWAVEKMLEDQVYWAVVVSRWLDDANFERGPARFFDVAPAPVRPLVKAVVRRSVRRDARGQGFGRHEPAEVARLGIRAIEALSEILGERPYLLGDTVSGSDATAYAFVAGLLCKAFETPLRDAAEARPNLVAYARRMGERYYPDLET